MIELYYSGSIWNRTTIITFKRLDMKYREYIQIVINWANPYMWVLHYSEVIMSAMVSQITGISIVYSTVCSGVDQRKHQSSMSLAFVRGIHQWLVNSPHKGPVTWKMFPFDDNIMEHAGFNSSKEKSGCPSGNLLGKIRLPQWRIRLPLLPSPIVNNKVYDDFRTRNELKY